MPNKYDFNPSNKYMTHLRNKIWKLLPIYEGKNNKGEIVESREKAYEKFYLSLSRLLVELTGAKNIEVDSGYYVELIYLLEGMKTFSENEHSRVRDIILHCCSLCEKINGVI